ncbi:MAG: ABC transporter ATP-binding protein [Chloroflexi bacterium]|nr:ABC transporter ATP-binding protein [Chloroflexota bacterium]
MLRVENVSSFYGLLQVLWGVSINIQEGEFVSLIGANGSGKTTLLKAVSGLVTSYRGTVIFQDRDISRMRATEVARLGLCLVPEGRLLYPSLTVVENLELGAFSRHRTDGKEDIRQDMEYVFKLFPILWERRKQKAESLSGGQAQVLAIARGLMSKPKLLILDEPSLGLAPLWVAEVFKSIQELHRRGITILLSEQNASASLGMADRAYVLERGRVVLEGTGKQLLNDENVKRAYLT